MGLAGARACEGGWLSGPISQENYRGHQEVLEVGRHGRMAVRATHQ
jgi:hypothetical protein